MEQGNLPIEIAQEPEEEARLSQPMDSANKQRKGVKITFAEATQSSENGSSQASATYKEALSQPAPEMSHRQRLLWLQRRRSAGLWAQCDDCDRWRFLPHIVDAHELPAKWRCRMNPDKSAADCSVPETPLRLRDEEDLIHSEYSAGSVVWARLTGWPWWPAMVDDCPDTEQYYWLDGFSDIPTHYNVVFFDAAEVTRAWISPENLQPYRNKKSITISKDKRYTKRLEVAMEQAEDADALPLEKRLEKYSFIARYNGAINKPKKITKQDLEIFQKKLKRKYDIAFPEEDEYDSDEPLIVGDTTTVIKKAENVLLVGTPKSKKNCTSKVSDKTINKKRELLSEENETEVEVKAKEIPTNDCNVDSEIFKQPDSLVVQMGSNVTSTVADVTMDNDTSVTFVPDSDVDSIRETLKKIEERAVTPSSDDFEFDK